MFFSVVFFKKIGYNIDIKKISRERIRQMMKITVDQSILLKALAHTQSIVERRQTIPILANVLLETTAEGVLIKATDNELEICEKIPASVEEPGAITVPAHKLYDIVRRLPDGASLSLSFQESSNQVNIVSGRSNFALASIAPEGFPSMAREETPFSFELPAEQLLILINQTSFAVSVEETRYNLNGIYLHEKEGMLAAVATDGHRLACAKTSLPEGAKDIPGVIIPRKTIGEVAKLAAENVESLQIALSANQIRFKMNDIELSSRLVDGTYPDYEKVIPTTNDKTLEADAKALANVIERVSVVSEKSKGIKLSLSENLLQVSATAIDEGFAKDELDAVYMNEELDIGFNYRYLLDILAQIKGQNVKITLQDGVSPVILQDAADTSSLFVLMPMRV